MGNLELQKMQKVDLRKNLLYRARSARKNKKYNQKE